MTPTQTKVLIGAGVVLGGGLLATGIVLLTKTPATPTPSGGGGSPGPSQPPAQGGGGGSTSGGGAAAGGSSSGGGGDAGSGQVQVQADPWADLKTRIDLFALAQRNLQIQNSALVIPSVFLTKVISDAQAGIDFAMQIPRDSAQPPANMNDLLGLTQSVANLKADQATESTWSLDASAQASVDAVVGAAQDTLTAAVSALPTPQGGGVS